MRLVLTATALVLTAGPLRAAEPPVVELYTMGPGDHIFTHFGHSALCVRDDRSPEGRCYNWGTADFSDPLRLSWSFLRGDALFWVSVGSLSRMEDAYTWEDRSVWRQRVPLEPERARALVERLDAATKGSERTYRYHHFLDNCTTRIRDHLDAALDGALSRASDSQTGLRFRDHTLEGFTGHLHLMAGTELLLGRFADQPTDLWRAMFLPEYLRDELHARVGAVPELIHERTAPLPRSSPYTGRYALIALGALLATVAAVLRRAGLRRIGALAIALPLGMLGAVLWSLAIVSALPELTRNEVLLVLLPTDLLLPLLGARWERRYVQVRLAGLGLVLLASWSGLLVQPLLAPLVLAGLPLAILRLVSADRTAFSERRGAASIVA